MTHGVGGSNSNDELEKLTDMTAAVRPVAIDEFHQRLAKAQMLMRDNGLHAIYVNAGTNLYYFTGMQWSASERMVGALIPAEGQPEYIAPAFELDSLRDFMLIEGEVNTWQEHESPYQLFGQMVQRLGGANDRIGVDEATPFFIFDGLRSANPKLALVSAKSVTAGCRMYKSAAELALLQTAKTMTLAVQAAAARMLRPGISTTEVAAFIHNAHRQVGANGSVFCIVLFGVATSFPHGVKEPQILQHGDMVLIDTGCLQQGYHSDITRSYVFGEPTQRQRDCWHTEQQAQAAAFAAAQPGEPCAAVDKAARELLQQHGYGPDYRLPGLPHRTGHGVGLDIHEWPYLVSNEETLLQEGMCFSNEPMLVIPGEFGIRLEDHFYMTATGPRWFTEPSMSIDNPFG